MAELPAGCVTFLLLRPLQKGEITLRIKRGWPDGYACFNKPSDALVSGGFFNGLFGHEKTTPQGGFLAGRELNQALTLASAALNVALGRMMAASLAWSGM